MSATSLPQPSLVQRGTAGLFLAGRVSVPMMVVIGCALLAGTAPITVSIVAVFLFAGPHNWLEARYFLTRMPARWGALTSYFLTGLAGTIVLGLLFATMPILAPEDAEAGLVLVAIWNTLLTTWIISLALMRSRQNPRRNWGLLVPLGLALIAVNWLRPLAWSLALVYLHPLMALWFLDRELQRSRSRWRKPYRAAMLIVPVCVVCLAARFAGNVDLPDQDLISWQITRHAGADVLPHVSTHFLVATHVFLELLHYIVWIAVIPRLSLQGSLWRVEGVPLARRSTTWRRTVAAVVVLGAAIIFLLWGAFLTDYAWTRNVYFTVAILHVLGEFPFLLRLL